jgi:hypothetical protein
MSTRKEYGVNKLAAILCTSNANAKNFSGELKTEKIVHRVAWAKAEKFILREEGAKSKNVTFSGIRIESCERIVFHSGVHT